MSSVSLEVNKAVKSLFDYAKDIAAQNIVTAVNRGDVRGVKMGGADIERIIMIVKASIDQAASHAPTRLDRLVSGDLASAARKTTKKNG